MSMQPHPNPKQEILNPKLDILRAGEVASSIYRDSRSLGFVSEKLSQPGFGCSPARTGKSPAEMRIPADLNHA